jgi:hypothetical protein
MTIFLVNLGKKVSIPNFLVKIFLISFLINPACSKKKDPDAEALAELAPDHIAKLFASNNGIPYQDTLLKSDKVVQLGKARIDSLNSSSITQGLIFHSLLKCIPEEFDEAYSKKERGVHLDATLYCGDQICYTWKKESKPFPGAEVKEDENHLLQSGVYPLQIILPWRSMGLPAGEHTFKLKFSISTFDYLVDSTKNPTKLRVRSIPENPVLYEAEYVFTAIAPPLYLISMRLNEAIIDTSLMDVHKCDFGFMGPGLPDLYWHLGIGGELVWHSEQKKNTWRWTIPMESPTFLAAEGDGITFKLLDYDHGPLNKDDLLYYRSQPLSALPINKPIVLTEGNMKKVSYTVFVKTEPSMAEPSSPSAKKR